MNTRSLTVSSLFLMLPHLCVCRLLPPSLNSLFTHCRAGNAVYHCASLCSSPDLTRTFHSLIFCDVKCSLQTELGGPGLASSSCILLAEADVLKKGPCPSNELCVMSCHFNAFTGLILSEFNLWPIIEAQYVEWSNRLYLWRSQKPLQRWYLSCDKYLQPLYCF